MLVTLAMLDRRLRHWRDKLAIVTAAIDREPLHTHPLAGPRAFFFRERHVCICMIAELEQLSAELQRH